MTEFYRSPTETSTETTTEDSDEKSSSKKSKKKTLAVGSLGELSATGLLEQPKESKPAPRIELLFDRLREEAGQKPDKSEESKESPAVTAEAAETADVEVLSPEEEREVIKQYVEVAKQELQADIAAGDAEAAADAALLEAVEVKMAENPDMPVAELLDEAEAEMVERIDGEVEKSSEIAPEAGNGEPEDEEAWASGGAGNGAEPPISSNGGAAGSAGGGVPPRGPVYDGGSSGFFSPGYAPGTTYNTAPAGTSVEAPTQDITAERRAMAQGVLAGGIVGYLVGRRRGRIKTEKRLLPIQQKLEKQVATLQSAVAAKEQIIRQRVAEKRQALPTPAEQARFGNRLATPRAEAVRPAARSFAERRPVERFRGGIIEAPAVILGAAAVLRPERRTQAARPERPAIDFSKNVETYSKQELSRAAEKITIQGTSLKELGQAHNLDERAIRRVVNEFVKGGNVAEALNREMIVKESRFERDPNLRQAASGGTVDAENPGTAAGGVAGSVFGNNGSSGTDKERASNTTKPALSDAALAQIRRQQTMQVGLASVGIILFFIVVVALLV